MAGAPRKEKSQAMRQASEIHLRLRILGSDEIMAIAGKADQEAMDTSQAKDNAVTQPHTLLN